MLTENYPMFRAMVAHATEADLQAALAKETRSSRPRMDMVLRLHARLTVVRRIREREALMRACMRPSNRKPHASLDRNR